MIRTDPLTEGVPLMNRKPSSQTVKIAFGWITTAMILGFYFVITSDFFKMKVILKPHSVPFLKSFFSSCIPTLVASTRMISIHSVFLSHVTGAQDVLPEMCKEEEMQPGVSVSPDSDLGWKEDTCPSPHDTTL